MSAFLIKFSHATLLMFMKWSAPISPTIETLYPGNQTDDFSVFKHVIPLHATFKLTHESDDCNEMQSLVLLQIMHTAETMQLHYNSKYELVHEQTTAF